MVARWVVVYLGSLNKRTKAVRFDEVGLAMGLTVVTYSREMLELSLDMYGKADSYRVSSVCVEYMKQ